MCVYKTVLTQYSVDKVVFGKVEFCIMVRAHIMQKGDIEMILQ